MDEGLSNTIWPPVGPCRVLEIRLVDLCEFKRLGAYSSTSLPGHLVHLFVSGRVSQEMNGRSYDMAQGHAVWYHEDELVRGQILQSPWRFYTCNFVAPGVTPPPFEERVWQGRPRTLAKFALLLRAWRDPAANAVQREMLVHSRLMSLLAEFTAERGQQFSVAPQSRLWWDLECRLREDLSRPISLTLMEELSGRSVATIARACKSALGLPPMKRVKQIRMSLARGLVQRSNSLLKEIAAQTGYARLHEFSRDYHKFFGVTPGMDRRRVSAAGPTSDTSGSSGLD